jgi:hypothetical protein
VLRPKRACFQVVEGFGDEPTPSRRVEPPRSVALKENYPRVCLTSPGG